jgi:hypothetical protein
MTKNNKYNYFTLLYANEELYDKYDMRVARLLWFLIGFCANFVFVLITSYITGIES